MSRTFRYREIAEELRVDIDRGRFDEGVLPSEADLAVQHDASRVTVRKALDLLRAEGLVSSRQGFGWFVERDPLRQSLDSLSSIHAELAEAGRTSERQVLEFRFVDAPAHVAAELGNEVLEVVRLHLADDQPFALVTVWCPVAVGAQLSREDVTQASFVELLASRSGSVRQVISAGIADAAAAGLLELDVGAALLQVRRSIESVDGTTLLVSEHRYPAHLTEFAVTLEASTAELSGLRLQA